MGRAAASAVCCACVEGEVSRGAAAAEAYWRAWCERRFRHDVHVLSRERYAGVVVSWLFGCMIIN